jgi:hypothetical protein
VGSTRGEDIFGTVVTYRHRVNYLRIEHPRNIFSGA